MEAAKKRSSTKFEGLSEQHAIALTKVLVVGAGGIGCELLKNLVCSGFKDVVVVDLDTIEVSNLNRQFLFRERHVKSSKARVAAETIKEMRPDVSIEAHHGNIKDSAFDRNFFKTFDIVFNALDNADARRHVNRLCLAAGVPLVESGSTGRYGQATPIMRGFSECYECIPQTAPKVFPYCTIRSTPEKPIHCIVWAKELFSLFFGDRSASSLHEEETQSAYMPAVLKGRGEIESAEAYAIRLLNVMYSDDIKSQLLLGKQYKTNKPTPRRYEDLLAMEDSAQKAASSAAVEEQIAWSPRRSAEEFVRCAVELFSLPGPLVFDKDEETALSFVTAASNLRSVLFGIELQSRWNVREMAGNIIPALATTNSIVAALQVIEALKLIRGMIAGEEGLPESCRLTFVGKKTRRRRGADMLLLPLKVPPPKPNCVVCGNRQAFVELNTKEMKLDTFVAKILRKGLAFNEPTLECNDSILYETGEDAEDFSELLCKSLEEVGIVDGAVCTAEDYSQELSLEIQISHVQMDGEEEDPIEGFTLTADPPKEKRGDGKDSGEEDDDDDDDLEICDSDDGGIQVVDGPSESPRKKARVE